MIMDSFTPIVFRFFLMASLLPATTSLPDFLRARRSDLLLDNLLSNEEPPLNHGSLSEYSREDVLESLKQIRLALQMVDNMRQMLDDAARKKLYSAKRFGPKNRFLRVGRAQNPAKDLDENFENKYYSEMRRNLDILKKLADLKHSDAPSSLNDGDVLQRVTRGDNNDGESSKERNEFLQVDERALPMNTFQRIDRAPRRNFFVRIGRASPKSKFVRIGRRSHRNIFLRIGKRSVRSVSNGEENEEEEEDRDSRNNNNKDEIEEQDDYDPQPLTFERGARNGEEMDDEDEERERYLQQLLQLQRRSAFVRIGRLPASVYIQRQRMLSGPGGRPQSLENLSRRRSPGFRFTDAGLVRLGKRASEGD